MKSFVVAVDTLLQLVIGYLLKEAFAGQIQTKVSIEYFEEVASEITRQKKIIDVGDYDLRAKRSPFDEINPFTIRHPAKSEKFLELENKLKNIQDRFEKIRKMLEKPGGLTVLTEEKLDAIEQLLEDGDDDFHVEFEDLDEVLFSRDDSSEIDTATTSTPSNEPVRRKRSSFEPDPEVKEEVYRQLMSKCTPGDPLCREKIKYINSSVDEIALDLKTKITGSVLNDLFGFFAVLVSSVMTIVNFFMIRRRYREFTGAANGSNLTEETGKRFDETGKRSDETLKRFDETGKRFDETEKRFDETGKRSDETGKRSDETLKRFDETGKRSDETDRNTSTKDKPIFTLPMTAKDLQDSASDSDEELLTAITPRKLLKKVPTTWL